MPCRDLLFPAELVVDYKQVCIAAGEWVGAGVAQAQMVHMSLRQPLEICTSGNPKNTNTNNIVGFQISRFLDFQTATKQNDTEYSILFLTLITFSGFHGSFGGQQGFGIDLQVYGLVQFQ